jgi:hypothetical protein
VKAIKSSYNDDLRGYAVKPLDTEKIVKVLRRLELID